MPLPPGPRLPASVQTLIYLAQPAAYLEWCQRRYGDAFTIKTLLFGTEACFVHPDAVKEVFTGDSDVMRAGEANAPLGPFLGRNSVLLLDGAEHLRQRRLLMPPLHGERMTSYGRTMIEVTSRVMAGWPHDRPLRLHPHTQAITMEVILRTVFGVEDTTSLGELRDSLTTLLNRQSSFVGSLNLMPALQHELWGLSPYAAFRRAIAHADSLVLREIEARRTAIARGGGKRDDILSLLIEARDENGEPMSNAELRDELVTLLVAGHETTATALCWAFDRIGREPAVLGRLRAELDAAGDDGVSAKALSRLPYLDATIKEVLRLCPVVPAVGRKLGAPAVVGGFELPAGTLVVPTIFLTNRHPSAYEAPEELRPERFLDQKPDPYAWIPFGGGIRRCLGMSFALYEMKAVLAAVLSQLDVRPVPREPDRIKLRAFMHAPEGGGKVVVTPRRRERAGRAPADRAQTAPSP